MKKYEAVHSVIKSKEMSHPRQKDILKALDAYNSPQRWIEALVEDMKSYLAEKPLDRPSRAFSLFQDIK